ncbi:lipase [Dysgonomonas sp. HDW5A]|uniref:GDSL-type esterase/lipase family protein n=1 Tax=Dysgonomonas sp. HDW5A TaxID=2714926 RepID=UPI001407B961|nr:GDSL-type esterase/lipase family protein [Dysgonomonas sp. HDW5A]QIK60856.1 lipase [Dysgonomonas sp. HDW5A]
MKTSILKALFISALLFTTVVLHAQNRDWANINRYKTNNKELVEAKKQIETVFIGNSITEGWVTLDPVFFTNNNYEGRGISGQISAQMLLRMREDVIKLKPRVVVINAGTNDIAENANVYDPEITLGNIISMVQLAQANDIRVVLGSVLPTNHFRWNPDITDVAGKVTDLNSRIKNYADANHIPYIDYHTALKDKDNGLDVKYGEDGVHPNIEGYHIMEPLAKEAINKALKQ